MFPVMEMTETRGNRRIVKRRQQTAHMSVGDVLAGRCLQDKRGRLTLMLILVCTSALGLELGADLLEQLDKTAVWRRGCAGYATMRVVHGGVGGVCDVG